MSTLNIAAPANKDAAAKESLPIVSSTNQPSVSAQRCRTTTTDIVAQREAYKAKQGQFAWAKLHGYRGCDPQWLDIWQYLIPQRCDCKDGYQRILAEMPPDYTSPEAFFAWGVRLHNAVNAKLGKPEITIEEAYKIWRNSDGLETEADINERP
jgi:hypothetical protein